MVSFREVRGTGNEINDDSWRRWGITWMHVKGSLGGVITASRGIRFYGMAHTEWPRLEAGWDLLDML